MRPSIFGIIVILAKYSAHQTNMVDNIINHNGVLRYRSRLHFNTYDEYTVVESPILKYSNWIGDPIAVTEDGRLYDIESRQYFRSYDNSRQVIDLSHLIFTYCLVNVTHTKMLTLTKNGDLYANNDSKCGEFLLFDKIDSDVDFIAKNDDGEVISIKKNEITIHYGSRYERLIIKEVVEFIGVSGGLPFTDSSILVLLEDGNYRLVEYCGRLIGCGIINYLSRCSVRQLVIATDEDGDLITRSRDLYIGIDYEIMDDIAVNHQLIRSHRISPWTEVILINNYPHLLNRAGEIVEIREEWAIIGTNIPTYILARTQLLEINLDQ